jgi:hypothetical protein
LAPWPNAFMYGVRDKLGTWTIQNMPKSLLYLEMKNLSISQISEPICTFYPSTTYVHIEFVQLFKFKDDTMALCTCARDELDIQTIQNLVVILCPWLLLEIIYIQLHRGMKKSFVSSIRHFKLLCWDACI